MVSLANRCRATANRTTMNSHVVRRCDRPPRRRSRHRSGTRRRPRTLRRSTRTRATCARDADRRSASDELHDDGEQSTVVLDDAIFASAEPPELHDRHETMSVPTQHLRRCCAVRRRRDSARRRARTMRRLCRCRCAALGVRRSACRPSGTTDSADVVGVSDEEVVIDPERMPVVGPRRRDRLELDEPLAVPLVDHRVAIRTGMCGSATPWAMPRK